MQERGVARRKLLDTVAQKPSHDFPTLSLLSHAPAPAPLHHTTATPPPLPRAATPPG